jgi:FtsP/CotA-like multicopper oxidase with cupredoxin domain
MSVYYKSICSLSGRLIKLINFSPLSGSKNRPSPYKRPSKVKLRKRTTTNTVAITAAAAILILMSVGVVNNISPTSQMAYAAQDNSNNNNNGNTGIQSTGDNNGNNNGDNKNNNNGDNAAATGAEDTVQPVLPTETSASLQLQTSTNQSTPNLASIPTGKNCAANLSERPNPIQYLTYFNCGHVSTFKNGTALRQFSLIASENNTIPISDVATNNPVLFDAWTFNNTIPGPTMRMTEGDHVMITVYNDPNSKHSHSLHMHSIHSGAVDGMTGPAGTIPPGSHFTYSFVASPHGVYPYHCHVEPVTSHINHGLYGVMIIDPKIPRPPAKEMVMLMNGYNLVDDYTPSLSTKPHPPTAADLRNNFSDATKSDEGVDNQIYTVNGQAFLYKDHPIDLVTGQEYRIHLVNMLEFDTANSFHLHGNMFEYYPSGTGMNPTFLTDIVTLGQGDRGTMEFTYHKTGMFMFHAHINRFTNLGWMGMFNVTDKPITTAVSSTTNSMSSMGQQYTTTSVSPTPGKDNSPSSALPFLQ